MGFLRCCVYYAALGAVSFFIGRLLPKEWFHADRFPYRCAPWEAKLYRVLRLAGQGARHEQDRPQAHPREKARLRLSRIAPADAAGDVCG